MSSSDAIHWPRRDAAHLLVSAGQMAQLEQQLFESGLPVEALMEKAALAISARLLNEPEALRQGALVLVGPGHNGGDALVVARELHLAGVRVRLWSPFERHKPLTEAHWRHARWLGIERLGTSPDPGEAALWIDGLFGIGQRRPPGAAIEALLAERARLRPDQLVAIDTPTGLCADSGRLLGNCAARARSTYCLGLLKQGLVQDGALAWVGELVRLDLGLPPALLGQLPLDQPLGLGGLDQLSAPALEPAPEAAKYGRGRLLVVSGSAAYPGAALLSLLGASASGCGSLRAAVPGPMAQQLWSQLPHVVLGPAPGEAGALDRLDAVLVGPGLGPAVAAVPADGPGGPLLWQALQTFAGLVVIDADGLNQLAAGVAGEAMTWLQGRQGPTWLTPHGGEFARLFPDLAGAPPLEAAGRAAARSGAALVLKGARSVIAAPDGRRWQLLEAAPEAARAGAGDVLAGYVAGRGGLAMAAGITAGEASTLAAAALAHAQAGLTARQRLGPGQVTPQALAATLGQ
ncbi:NAD(P)H-hydrate epimerase [Synechococcus sp. CS-1329]|uniref:NAD(P)H-hydrate epimerase n=1 Tax=Synechococcus sp. CS-1329 TaxID=2847975 RepID=UPI00223A7C9A|nr:NAD(P)H-hydrate epimerase [Synechococcus sp. CS-1329]MCT0218000.1 NAD(P)H-hydrate epimerase [Synechococcus sp. CS-1329]